MLYYFTGVKLVKIKSGWQSIMGRKLIGQPLRCSQGSNTAFE